MEKLITKSKFMNYLQCPLMFKKLHIDGGRQELDEVEQHQVQQGNDIGLFATNLFPDGIDAQANNLTDSVSMTKSLIEDDFLYIYEASFLAEDLFARVDILHTTENGVLEIYEVKGSTKVKEEHLYDLAFQKITVENSSNLPVEKTFIIHLNKDYIYYGVLNIMELFIISDVTEEVEALRGEILNKLAELRSSLKNGLFNTSIGPHCSTPRDCKFKSTCWRETGDILNLRRGGKKAWNLYEKGITEISKIPLDVPLTSFQQLQYKAAVGEGVVINFEGLESFFNQLEGKIHYLDFEGLLTGIPIWRNTKVYSQIPFQVSLHVLGEDGDLEHLGYLNESSQDPREGVAKFLVENINPTGSVIVYFEQYEKARIKELQELFPKYKKDLQSIIDRIVDLEKVFSKGYYVSSLFGGSTSLKKTFPVICPLYANAYSDLPLVNNGQLAYIKYLKTLEPLTTPEEKNKIYDALIRYCRLDTYSLHLMCESLLETLEARKANHSKEI